MYLFSAAKQASTVKSSGFSLKLKKRAHGLRHNETKPDTENASNSNYFGFGVSNKSKCDEMAMFRVFLQNVDLYLKP